MTGERLARFHIRVHASNRNAEYSTPVVVIAASRRDAIDRAIALGWSGRAEDARVVVDRVEDIHPADAEDPS